MLSVILITFVLMRLVPGSPWDPGDAQTGLGVPLSDTAVRHLDATYGLDRPWWEQLIIYLRNVARFDFGDSYHYTGQRVSALIGASLPETFALGAIALAFIVPAGVGLGALAALRKNSVVDYGVTALATLGASIPNFVAGLLLILLFSVGLNRLTAGAFFLKTGGFALDQRLILPVVTLSLLPVAFIARLTRSSVLESLGQDHVRTARAKGLRERNVFLGHVLKTSLVPVVTTLGPLFSFLVTGSVVVESLFVIPGLGGTFVQAVAQRDYPVILAATIVFAAVVAIANLVVDLLYVALDARVRPS